MVDKTVLHTNTYAYIHITSKKYTNLDESWKETTSDEIFRLIALLIYFGLVKVTGEVLEYINSLPRTVGSSHHAQPSWPYYMW